jgi:hypothetical protein
LSLLLKKSVAKISPANVVNGRQLRDFFPKKQLFVDSVSIYGLACLLARQASHAASPWRGRHRIISDKVFERCGREKRWTFLNPIAAENDASNFFQPFRVTKGLHLTADNLRDGTITAGFQAQETGARKTHSNGVTNSIHGGFGEVFRRISKRADQKFNCRR